MLIILHLWSFYSRTTVFVPSARLLQCCTRIWFNSFCPDGIVILLTACFQVHLWLFVKQTSYLSDPSAAVFEGGWPAASPVRRKYERNWERERETGLFVKSHRTKILNCVIIYKLQIIYKYKYNVKVLLKSFRSSQLELVSQTSVSQSFCRLLKMLHSSVLCVNTVNEFNDTAEVNDLRLID